jgi:hypothetical protein
MDRRELCSEYVGLLGEKASFQKSLDVLKNGYKSTKTDSGKAFTYHQYQESVDGKLPKKYVKAQYLPDVQEELNKREELLVKIRQIDARLEEIEAAASLVDDGLRNKLASLSRCATLDAMAYEDRVKALAFGAATTTLNDISVSEEIKHNLSQWANGNSDFRESYLKTLRDHRLTEE